MGKKLRQQIESITQQLKEASPEEKASLQPELNALLKLLDSDEKDYHALLDRYTLALKGIDDGVWDWDIGSNVVIYSHRWNEILGFGDDPLPNTFRTWENQVHPDDYALALKPVRDYLYGNENHMRETVYRMKTKNGAYIYTSHRGYAEFDKDGHPVRLVGTMRNVDDEMRTQFALIEQNEFINSILDSSPQLIFVKDAKGRFLKVNRAVGQLFGKDPSELEYQPNSHFHSNEEELAAFDETDTKVRNELRTITIEEKFTNSIGKELWFETIKTPIRAKNGEINVLGISVEITDEKIAQRALERKEKEYRDLVNALSVVVYRINKDSEYTFLNPAWNTILEHSVEETIGKTNLSFTHPEDVPELTRKKSMLYSGEIEELILQIRVKHNDGSYRNMKVISRLQYNENDEIIGTQGTLIDVHENVKYAEELKTRQAIFKTISDNSIDMIALHEVEGVFRFISPSSEKLLGFTPDELIGTHPAELYHPDDVEEVIRVFNQYVLRNLDSGTTEFRLRRKSGEYIWVESNASVIINERDEILFIQTSTRNITERKIFERQLKQNVEREKELSTLRRNFVSMASHQFRTPLTIMKSNLEVLEYQFEKYGEIKEKSFEKTSARINQEINNMVNLMHDILILGKLDADQTKLEKEPTDVIAFIKSIIKEQFSSTTNQRRIQVHSELNELKIPMDKNLMKQVFDNLLNNALKYSAHSKDPEVFIRSESDWQIVEVKDYGMGIPQKDIESLFQPFFRATNSTHVQGSGLGLSIVKQFVELHGGKVELQSKLNEGTTFTVYLKK